MLPRLCISFRDAKGRDRLRGPLRLGRVQRRVIAKGSHRYFDVIILPVIEASLLTTRAKALSSSSISVK